MRITLTLLTILLGIYYTAAQCDGGTLNSSLIPTGAEQNTTLSNGDYFTVDVSCGSTYHFYTDGSWDTQITINQTDGSTDLAYDDDGGSGTLSDIIWTSNFTGTIQVLITRFSCENDGTDSGTLYYSITSTTPSTDFDLTSTSCTSASANVTGMQGGAFSFNPTPGDGASINSSTGSITNGVAGTTYYVEYTVCNSSSIESIEMPGANNTFDFDLVACDEASAVQLTGETGGSFSFATNPGGGTQINSVTGVISNADPGDTYSIEYDVCGITTSFNYTFPTNLASFDMIEVCGGGVPNITGISGGSFSFSPDPGDGSQINATTGVVSNGMVGETYTIEYTACGVTSQENVLITSDNCFTLNGDAEQIIVNGEDCIQLTDESNSLNGCAWNGSTINFASNFSLSLDYYFGDNGNGADGNTFTFQPSSSTACGNDGEQLGAGGIANALVIEFDTYENSYSYDLSCDHVAITTDGDLTSGTPAAGPECAKSNGGNIDDGGVYEVEIVWDVNSQTLSVYFDGDSVLSYTDDIINNVFGGTSEVFWGATAATGGLNNQQYFCPSTIVILGIDLSEINTFCNGSEQFISWVGMEEENIDHYSIEYTYDGFIFYPYQTVKTEDKDEDDKYLISVNMPTENIYYRIKTVDRQGEFKNTELFRITDCNEFDFTVMYDESLHIKSDNIAFTAKLYDTKGALVAEKTTLDNELQFNNTIESGVYIIRLEYLSGEVSTKKYFMYQ